MELKEENLNKDEEISYTYKIILDGIESLLAMFSCKSTSVLR